MRRPKHKRPWELATEMSAANFGLLLREQLLGTGLSPSAIDRKIKSGELRVVYRGVYRMASSPTSWCQRILAPCLRLPGMVWVCGRTAAAFWELDGSCKDVIEVVSPRGLRCVDEVIVHRTQSMSPRDVTVVKRIPITTVHRTLVDLGDWADVDQVELALESALRRRITSVDRLLRQIVSVGTKGRRGATSLLALLDAHERKPTESALETRFAQLVRRYDIPRPSRQVKVRDGSAILARVDFFWDSSGVVWRWMGDPIT
jgi:hypothetical protein